MTGHGALVLSVSFDNQGILASSSGNGLVKIWDIKTGDCLRTLTGHGGTILGVSLSNQGMLASSSWDGIIKLWKRV